MRAPSVAARRAASEPEPNEREGEAKLAEAVHAAIERFGPAADTIAGCGERLDKLCRWLSSWKPWAVLALFLTLGRTVNAAPEDVASLAKAAADVARAFQ